MPGARRDALAGADGARAEHAGLLLASYLESQDEGSKKTLFEQAVKACGRARPVYEMAFERWRQSLPAGTIFQKIGTQGRFVTGLGMASALETGIRLHHTYGTPLIPGSGLKGLCAHYCDQVWGGQHPEFREEGAIHRVLFGDTAEAGMIVFHDSWILPGEVAGSLVADVMTPHHQKYGAGAGAAPSDFDSPIPVGFLSIRGKFLVAITPAVQGEGSERWTGLALKLAGEALSEWGAGAKTRSGYGRFQMVGA